MRPVTKDVVAWLVFVVVGVGAAVGWLMTEGGVPEAAMAGLLFGVFTFVAVRAQQDARNRRLREPDPWEGRERDRR